jgi:hypothetical protein
MDVHGGTPYPMALDLPMSLARAYFDTEVHQSRVKNGAAAERIGMAVISRLDVLLKAFGGLAKAISSRR